MDESSKECSMEGESKKKQKADSRKRGMLAEEKKSLIGYILQYMRQNQINQKEMAQKLNITAAALSLWLCKDGAGIRTANAEQIRFICREIIEQDNIRKHKNDMHLEPEKVFYDEFRNGLIEKLIDSDIPGDALKTVLQIVKNYNPKKDPDK